MQITEKISLADFTTFAIGGTARFFVSVSSVAELAQALEFARQKSLPAFVFGNGSNVLVSDAGFDGLVIHNQIRGLAMNSDGSLVVGAGENWDDIVRLAVEKNLAGIECLSGVPGSAGGAVVQNIGAYGQTLSDRITEASVINVATGQEKLFTPQECGFGYRASYFKQNLNQYVITGFKLKLEPGGIPIISYPQVAKHFGSQTQPSLSEVREFIIKLRAAKGYLIMPGFERYNTAGSFFKNPIVSPEVFSRLAPMLGDASLNRYWPMSYGVKLAAAFLMQEAGFGKGYREGRVGISPKHALSLTNFGQAQAAEIKSLADKIKAVVFEKFGVQLEEEVLYVGKFN